MLETHNNTITMSVLRMRSNNRAGICLTRDQDDITGPQLASDTRTTTLEPDCIVYAPRLISLLENGV